MRQIPRRIGGEALRKIIVTLLALVAVLGVAPLTHAAVPVAISGTFTGGFNVTDTRLADGNTIFTIDNSIHLLGDVRGVCVDKAEFLIIHPDVSDNFNASCVFAAQILGQTGTITLTFEGRGQGTSFHGEFVVGQGTDSLSSAHIQGVFSGVFTSATTFAGNISGQLF